MENLLRPVLLAGEVRVPPPEAALKFMVERLGTVLEQQVRSPFAPPHLLLLAEAFIDHGVDRRFGIGGRDRFP
jgi:hypothetical protein